MDLTFSVEQFLKLFKSYNRSVFPLQFLFYILALTIVFLSLKKIKGADRIINSILTFFWLWMGIVYHLLFFSTINKTAYLFGSFFIVQGILFFYFGVIKQKLTYKLVNNVPGIAGAAIVIFALIGYPLLGYLFGHIYPYSPTFGVPCPTTIFTFGVLLWSNNRVPKVILLIPFLWSLLGFSAATTLGIREDMALIVAGFISTGILLRRKNTNDPGKR